MWIYLIRHAETDGNIQRIVQVPETPLSERGEKQAQQLGRAYANEPIAKVLSSDYARTRATANALSKEIGCTLTFNELLRERHFGELRGMCYDDIKDDFFARGYQPPGGESYVQFVERIQKAWSHINAVANEQTASLAVVSHGLVIRCIMTEILKLPPAVLAATDVKNTSVIKIRKNDFNDIPLLCDINHLDRSLVHG